MTATDRLHELLDKLGVEWQERVWGIKHSVTTFWHARGVRWHYRENRFGELRLHADGLTPEQAIAATLGVSDATHERQSVADLEVENAKLRKQMEWLVTLLRNDCDIDASWDGLRRFWIIGLTEDGCLMRDRACKAEAENAKLRELVLEIWRSCPVSEDDCAKCPHRVEESDEVWCDIPILMEALGVEVDE